MLFAGTGHAFFYSMDDGAHWVQHQQGLPPAPVSWIVVQKRYHDVVLSTYGRGLYILDDVTPLEQPVQTTEASTPRLFAPRQGFRLARSGRAQFTYSLPAASPVQMEILDSAGAVIAKLDNVSARQGLNRAAWDLRYERPQYVELRTTPRENPHIWEEPRFKGQQTRAVTHWGLSPAQVGPIAAPGKYSVRMTAGGQTLTQPFEVIKDPSIPSSDDDLRQSTVVQIRIRDDIDVTSGMVNHLERMRRQLEDEGKAQQARPELVKAIADLDRKMQDVEAQLLERSQWLSDDKYFQQAYKVYSNLIWLNGAVGTGASDEAGGADFRPTDAQMAVLAAIEKDLDTARTGYRALLEKDVPAFNKTTAGKVTPLNVKGS
jgi:hypothetical protein